MFCFANVKMRSYWIRVYSKSNDSCLFKKRQHSKIHIQVRWPCDNGDRDWGHGAARKKKKPRIAKNHQKLERSKEEFSPSVFRGSMALKIFELKCLAFKSVRE